MIELHAASIAIPSRNFPDKTGRTTRAVQPLYVRRRYR